MSKKVSIYTLNQLWFDGSRPVAGGLERYMRDIALLMREMGYEVNFFQNGITGGNNWTADYLGFKVHGIPPVNGQSNVEEMDRLSHDKVLYAWIGQQQKYKYKGISINHGIWWDNPGNGEGVTEGIKPWIRAGLQNSQYMVSVCTAFINWCRSSIPNEVQGKLKYIPNYVDLKKFYPQEKTRDKDKITILYPRRIDPVRGIEVCYRLAPRILAKYPHVKFKFALDRNHEHLWKQFVDWAESQEHKDRIEYGNFYFDDIPNAYREADIVLLPTQMSEGTSLSCLEALGTGKAIVTTIVGGLTDLVIPRHNGLLVDTDDESIFEALCELIEDHELRRELSHNAAISAKAFSKERWDEQWSKLIAKAY